MRAFMSTPRHHTMHAYTRESAVTSPARSTTGARSRTLMSVSTLLVLTLTLLAPEVMTPRPSFVLKNDRHTRVPIGEARAKISLRCLQSLLQLVRGDRQADVNRTVSGERQGLALRTSHVLGNVHWVE